jgi:exonuclease III
MEELKQMVTSVNSDIVCIQETKLVVISPSIVRNSLGSTFQNNHVYLLAAGTKGDSNSSQRINAPASESNNN